MLFPLINPFSRFGNTLDLTYGNTHKLLNKSSKHRPLPLTVPDAERRICSDIDQKIDALDSFFNEANKDSPVLDLPSVKPKTIKHVKNGSSSFLAVERKSIECTNPPVGYYNPIYDTCHGQISKHKRSSSNKVRRSDNCVSLILGARQEYVDKQG
jgi:hypothetical protein